MFTPVHRPDAFNFQISNMPRTVTPETQIVKPITELDKSIPLHDIVNVP